MTTDINKVAISESDIERFWAHVHKSGENECWLWHTKMYPIGEYIGYGSFAINGESFSASRVSYLLRFGSIPKGMLVCHHCDNPPCVNPNHLFLGTHRDNTMDSVIKGRRQIIKKDRAERAQKLREKTVINGDVVRFFRRGLDLKCKQLSRLSGVSTTTIIRIENGDNRYPSVRTLIKLANALGVNLTDFYANTASILARD